MSHDAPTARQAAEITRRNVRTVRELEQLAVADPSFADRTASFVARFCGSIHFVWVHAAVFGAWFAVNSIPGLPHWDPYPFTFLTMWASTESIFIAAFILIAQNYAMRLSERRAQLDLQINLLAEQETTKTLQMLELIAQKVGAQVGHDPEVAALAEATRLDSLAKQIDETQKEQDREETGSP
ncbi:DUF1003 domain-containing protein [Ramlibacter sp. USB13]|uniref:DUF1003 domain-containing protein n=1 Tax=Ramlibacter cellulosilyticus TaxID=2764187 RepID=A0A923MXA5_9BURK|nr:DUF1003 domain-containing protein [Ramlibacter cellulosilyticus]MBC5785839.1 DUF1003 domain-containing protein [Ramlibacter cellulosilyticus]